MVTHEQDIAAYARRNVVMRDGVVRDDFAVANRFDSSVELARLTESTVET
jgi:hypothetical protein